MASLGEWFADVNVVDRVAHNGRSDPPYISIHYFSHPPPVTVLRSAPKSLGLAQHSGGGVMVWAGVCCGKQTQVHFMNGVLNTQRYRDEIMRPIVVPFIHDHHLVLQHDNARPRVARICTKFLEAENILVLTWPAYSPDMSPIEYVWDALDRRIRQRVPVPANIQKLRTAIEEEWTNIPQATINNLINSMRRRCVALREANGGHTIYSKTAHFRVAFYCGQPKAHLCNNHAV